MVDKREERRGKEKRRKKEQEKKKTRETDEEDARCPRGGWKREGEPRGEPTNLLTLKAGCNAALLEALSWLYDPPPFRSDPATPPLPHGSMMLNL